MIMIDDPDSEYLLVCLAPGLDEVARAGSRLNVRGMMPSVTNVNNVSLVTGSYPETHGITSNYWMDRELRSRIIVSRLVLKVCYWVGTKVLGMRAQYEEHEFDVAESVLFDTKE